MGLFHARRRFDIVPVEVTEPNVTQAVPFFMVANMEASLRFYVDGLGFEMTRKWTPRGKSSGAGYNSAERPSCFRSS